MRSNGRFCLAGCSSGDSQTTAAATDGANQAQTTEEAKEAAAEPEKAEESKEATEAAAPAAAIWHLLM